MFLLEFDKNINRLVITTDDPNVHNLLERKTTGYGYIPWKRCSGYSEKIEKIYDPGRNKIKGGYLRYYVGPGWTAYILGLFKDRISQADYDYIIQNTIIADSYRTTPFKELRDYQNEDVLFLLKYKRGLMTVNTGYGKTQTIATLANYAHEGLGKKVLLVCPSNKARDELVKRCKNVFGLDVSNSEKSFNGHLDCIITSGLSNSSRVKDPVRSSEFKRFLAEYDWVLADEVEYTINAGGEFLYDNCLGATRFYGFSGTADKTLAETISFSEGLSDVVMRNKDLIKYFGPSLIYRMPLGMEVSNVTIRTEALDNLYLDDEKLDSTGNLYLEIMNQIWTDPGICRVIQKTIDRYPMLFIPINNLNFIIDHWIQNYFIGRYRVLLISSRGYEYFDLEGNITNLTLDEVCDYAKNGMIDVIPGTASSYRALDIPRLENIFLIQGVRAGIVLQAIGRVARGKHMNIISISPTKSSKKIPIYTKGAAERDDMLNNYYQFCNITNIVLTEDMLDNDLGDE